MRGGDLASRSTVGALVLLAAAAATAAPARAGATWPAATRESRPWTRWWWLGSAVDEAGLTRQLESLAAAGFGGVEICPIYGAKGWEDRYVPFLSPGGWSSWPTPPARRSASASVSTSPPARAGRSGGRGSATRTRPRASSWSATCSGALVPSAKRPIQKVKRAAPGR